MATTSKINIDPFGLDLFEKKEVKFGSCIIATEILQETNDFHHVYFNLAGLHNHIIHHTITALALGADPEILDRHYLKNKSYQLPLSDQKETIIGSLSNYETFRKYQGDNRHYLAFLNLFRSEIERLGYKAVLNRYLFEGDELAHDMLDRFSTFHRMIHLACGLEFKQPAIIAQALALTAITVKKIGDFQIAAEIKAVSLGKPSKKIIQAVAADKKIAAVTSWEEKNKFSNGPIQMTVGEVEEHAA